ncbi:MAG: HlyD family secretion protein [Cellvibrionaceae bacterium]|jgi:HlyD family secretion protein
MLKIKLRKHLTVLLGLLLLSFLIACSGENAGGGADDEAETVVALIGDISSAATASGQIDSVARAELAVTIQALVTNVNVRVGDQVKAGDVLMEFDTTELVFTLRNAQQNLLSQQAAFVELQEPASEADRLSAEANLASAQARLASLETGPNEYDVAVAEANLRSAQASIASAQANLNSTLETVTPANIEAARAELVAAENQLADIESTLVKVGDRANKRLADAYEAAKASYSAAVAKFNRLQTGADANAINAQQQAVSAASARAAGSQADLADLQAAASAADLAAAQATVASADARLQALLAGAKVEDIVIAEANVKSAEISVANAQSNLNDAVITAPFDGVVTAIHTNIGETATGIVLEMADPNDLEIVLQVDEIDIAAISIGQEATISLETWPDIELSSMVQAVAPSSGSTSTGITSYDVHLELADTDLPILIGMTANASLLTAKRDGVLVVVNRAITADRSSGRFYVDVQTTNDAGEVSIEKTEVSIGLRDSQFSQIIDGISEGDILVVDYTVPVRRPGEGGPPGG